LAAGMGKLNVSNSTIPFPANAPFCFRLLPTGARNGRGLLIKVVFA